MRETALLWVHTEESQREPEERCITSIWRKTCMVAAFDIAGVWEGAARQE